MDRTSFPVAAIKTRIEKIISTLVCRVLEFEKT